MEEMLFLKGIRPVSQKRMFLRRLEISSHKGGALVLSRRGGAVPRIACAGRLAGSGRSQSGAGDLAVAIGSHAERRASSRCAQCVSYTSFLGLLSLARPTQSAPTASAA